MLTHDGTRYAVRADISRTPRGVHRLARARRVRDPISRPVPSRPDPGV